MAKLHDRQFHEMTADELASYSGDIFTARCVLISLDGKEYPNDFQAPSQNMLDTLVRNCKRHVVSRTDYHTTR